MASGVRFTPDVVRRIAGFSARLAAASSREDSGRARSLGGAGEELVGHRPYRRGEDLRHLDWALLARLEQPFVRVFRASRRESWLVGVDVSASMAIGAPSKLQSCAEAAAAAVAIGRRLGARVDLLALEPGAGRPRRVALGTGPALGPVLRALEQLECAPEGGGLEDLLSGERPELVRAAAAAGARRVLLFGDFLDVDPRALIGLARVGGRRIHLGQVLAPEELTPVAEGADAATWTDPEAPDAPPRRITRAGLARYQRRLDGFVDRLARIARDHRMCHEAWSSASPFESHVPGLLR